MTSLLSTISFSLLEEGYQIGLNWIGQFAKVIIEGVGIIGLGIIVFTLVLKAITLPFDIYQRVKMRKQTLMMREMQPELEKLQKQYENDKTMYQQKMMELYKKNGYSMLGACLPMIISLVILIVAFSGFRAYASYANLNMYMHMSEAYNAAVLENAPDGIAFVLSDPEEGETLLDLTGWEEADGVYTLVQDGILYSYEEETGRLTVFSEDETVYLGYVDHLKTTDSRDYSIDTERLYGNGGEIPYTGDADDIENGIMTAKAKLDALMEADEDGNTIGLEEACRLFVVKIGALAAADWYHENSARFLWIKNVWYPDVSYSHPIQSYSSFSSSFSSTDVTMPDGTKKSFVNVLDTSSYENLVSELTEETTQANGYFILIILSIGLMFLSQFISMRSQKESNKYQTVDGSGARNQKIMLVVMPIIYAIFAFMYSAAFSIYMVMSSLVSIIVTLLSNLIIGKMFRKKEAEQAKAKYTRTLPWMNADGTKKYNNKKK